jgi:enoyl-CoA hydratase/carnithine racemase
MNDAPLLFDRAGRVATLTMNRPAARNALDRDLLLAIVRAFADVEADLDVRAVVLTGSGGSFCAGADLKKGMAEGLGQDMGARIDEFHAAIRAIVSARVPVVAAVDGGAVGFGSDLALACDLRVLSSSAYLQEKFVQIGLMPDGGGTYWLPRLVGTGRALELLMLGEKITAERALELGLANRVVADEQLPEAARELAGRLADGPPLAIAAIKRSVRQGWADGLDAALAREKTGQVELLRSQDVLTGVMAWMQGTKPEFSGR